MIGRLGPRNEPADKCHRLRKSLERELVDDGRALVQPTGQCTETLIDLVVRQHSHNHLIYTFGRRALTSSSRARAAFTDSSDNRAASVESSSGLANAAPAMAL